MEVGCVTIINLFFVPMFAVMIYAKRHQINTEQLSLRMVGLYMRMAAVIVPVMKGISFLVDYYFHFKLPLWSGYYTIVAIVVSALLPYGLEILQKCFAVECEIKK